MSERNWRRLDMEHESVKYVRRIGTFKLILTIW